MGAGCRLYGVGQAVEYRRCLFVADRQRWEQPYDTGVGSTEFDDQSTAQAFALDGGGEFGSGG
jgi:hypothetical protein